MLKDLSGLTLQTGTRGIVKDEYTPGSSIVGQGNLEIDIIGNNDIGTVQHHPILVSGISYTSIAMHHQSGECFIFSLY